MSTPLPEVPPEAALPGLAPGNILGKYRILREIGKGGMGVVLEAEHLGLGRRVAIKVLLPDASRDRAHEQRFQREAELVSRIGHKNLVEVYDFGRTPDGQLYFVMELLAGETLRTRLQRGPLADAELAPVFAPLLSAVHAAHQIGAVHRDLKPDNIMLVPDDAGGPPQVKLLDFGVAKVRAERCDGRWRARNAGGRPSGGRGSCQVLPGLRYTEPRRALLGPNERK
jgi:serine/threonine-protein kinase